MTKMQESMLYITFGLALINALRIGSLTDKHNTLRNMLQTLVTSLTSAMEGVRQSSHKDNQK